MVNSIDSRFLYVRFPDGSTHEFDSFADFQSHCHTILQDSVDGGHQLVRAGWWERYLRPDGSWGARSLGGGTWRSVNGWLGSPSG